MSLSESSLEKIVVDLSSHVALHAHALASIKASVEKIGEGVAKIELQTTSTSDSVSKLIGKSIETSSELKALKTSFRPPAGGSAEVSAVDLVLSARSLPLDAPQTLVAASPFVGTVLVGESVAAPPSSNFVDSVPSPLDSLDTSLINAMAAGAFPGKQGEWLKKRLDVANSLSLAVHGALALVDRCVDGSAPVVALACAPDATLEQVQVAEIAEGTERDARIAAHAALLAQRAFLSALWVRVSEPAVGREAGEDAKVSEASFLDLLDEHILAVGSQAAGILDRQ